MALLIDIDDIEYGAATAPILSLIDYISRPEWFGNHPGCASEIAANLLLTNHFDSLRAYASSLATLGPIEYLHRDWAKLAPIVEESRYDWNSPPWRTVLGRIMENLRASPLYETRVAELVGPPIWHFPGSDVVVSPIIANRDALAPAIPPGYRHAAWILLCDADAVLHDAIMWAIQSIGQPRDNPFEPLLAMYREQIIPLGFSKEGSFVVFLG